MHWALVVQPLPFDSFVHWPLVQLAPLGQAWPQAPQLPVFEAVFTQLPLQFVKPALQVKPQVPLVQVAVELPGAKHAVPQLPQ